MEILMNRREMLKAAGGATAISILGGIPLNVSANDRQTNVLAKERRKIMVIGAHPDDPETAAGGTMCLLSDAGHEVVSVYLTKGEAGIKGKSHAEAAVIREGEALAACKVTGARPLFLGQIDGSTEVNRNRYQEMREMLEREKPDVVITHWPIDGHRDHAACGILVLDSWKRLGRPFELYYFEVMTGTQTQMFHPTDFVDITTTQERKHQACYCHASQKLQSVMADWHIPMEQFRGIECRCKAAEAFARHVEPASLV
jgi:LmbE family N-acetylglucosaminyl deacetylase